MLGKSVPIGELGVVLLDLGAVEQQQLAKIGRRLGADDVAALVDAADTTVATLLPGVEFSTRSPYPDARRLLAAGATVALATDCNPGTSYTTSMPLCIALAVREMNMTV